MFFLRLLSNRNFIFILALVLGLSLGDAAGWVRHLTIPAVAVVMTVSMTQLPITRLIFSKEMVKPVLWSVALNYILFGGVTLLLAWYLVPNKQLWYGFVIVAAAPPGVAIAPFTGILSGNVRYSLVGVIGAYFVSLLVIPAVGLLFLGDILIEPSRLFIILAELIIGPLIVSQILIHFNISRYIDKWRGKIVNWSLFVVIFAVIALNRDVFFTSSSVLARAGVIAFVPIFGIGFLMEFILFRTKMARENISSLILFGTVKNGGFAAATALSLFGENASLSGGITTVFIIIYLIILTMRAGKFSR
ncbi:MAG: bile acid:sodium symporter family protein [Actinomycetota bacterium]